MKEKKSNSVTNFQPESITDEVSVEFIRSVDGNSTNINGVLAKGGENVGDVNYDQRNDFLIVRLKPFSSLTEEEVAAVHVAVPGFIKEMLS